MNEKFKGHLLVSDIDGTLAVGDYVAPSNLQAVAAFIRAGGTVALATGRSPQSAVPVARRINAARLLICNNGASIYDCTDGSVKWEKTLDFADEIAFARRGFPNVGVLAYYRDELRAFQGSECISRLIKSERLTLSDDESTIANKLLFGASPNELAELRVSCEANLDLSKIELVSADEQYLELLPNGVGKEQAMLRAADMLGIERDKIYAAGNYYNDVGMLDSARLSCTPEDAPEAVRDHADFIACPCKEGALADFIKWLFATVE